MNELVSVYMLAYNHAPLIQLCCGLQLNGDQSLFFRSSD